MLIEKIYNVETEETIERALSDEAVAQLQAAQEKIDAQEIALNGKLQARQIVLDKLGLTSDEAALLIS